MPPHSKEVDLERHSQRGRDIEVELERYRCIGREVSVEVES